MEHLKVTKIHSWSTKGFFTANLERKIHANESVTGLLSLFGRAERLHSKSFPCPWILCPAMNLTDNCAKYYRSAVLKHLQVMSTSFLSTSGRIFADKAHEWQGFRFFARKNHRKFWVFSALKHRSLLKLTFSCIFVIYRTRRVSLTTETWKVLVAFKSYGLKSRKLRKLPRAKHYFTREIYISGEIVFCPRQFP